MSSPLSLAICDSINRKRFSQRRNTAFTALLALTSTSQERVEALADELGLPAERVFASAFDATDPASVDGLVSGVVERFGGLHVLLNTVGGWGGVDGLTKSMARELGSYNITVNAVAPGMIRTDMTERALQRDNNDYVGQIPMNRVDVFGLFVQVPVVKETTSLGAAMCALVRPGQFTSLSEAAQALVRWDRTVEPHPNRVAAYQHIAGQAIDLQRGVIEWVQNGSLREMWRAAGVPAMGEQQR